MPIPPPELSGSGSKGPRQPRVSGQRPPLRFACIFRPVHVESKPEHRVGTKSEGFAPLRCPLGYPLGWKCHTLLGTAADCGYNRCVTGTTYDNVRIWDGLAETYLEARSITIESGLIRSVDESGSSGRDCAGLTVVPGLMDAHVHMTLDPTIFSVDAQLARSPDDIREKMVTSAERMVRAGITTARDLGGGAWLELELRDRINRGEIPGPRLLCAGQPVTSVQGHCHFWGGESATVDDAYEVIERQHDHGVDLIKIMATGGNLTKGSQPGEAQFGDVDTKAIVDKARSLQYEVAAHCHGTDGIRNAAAAGVTTIEHCSWIAPDGSRGDYDAAVGAEIIANGVWVSPTINAGWQRFRGGDGKFEERIHGIYRQFKADGVQLIASTDAGIPNVRHEDLALALSVFAHFAELTPLETLRAATVNNAKALAITDVAGTIAPGMSADLLFVEGDPLADLTVLQNPALVVARGMEFSPQEN